MWSIRFESVSVWPVVRTGIANKDIIVNDTSYKTTIVYKIWLDDEEIGEIEQDKRIVAMVKGPGHKIVIESLINQDLEEKKYESFFKLRINESALINIPALVNSLDDWIIKTR